MMAGAFALRWRILSVDNKAVILITVGSSCGRRISFPAGNRCSRHRAARDVLNAIALSARSGTRPGWSATHSRRHPRFSSPAVASISTR